MRTRTRSGARMEMLTSPCEPRKVIWFPCGVAGVTAPIGCHSAASGSVAARTTSTTASPTTLNITLQLDRQLIGLPVYLSPAGGPAQASPAALLRSRARHRRTAPSYPVPAPTECPPRPRISWEAPRASNLGGDYSRLTLEVLPRPLWSFLVSLVRATGADAARH